MGVEIGFGTLHLFQLGGVHPRMVAGIVAEPTVEQHRPRHAETSKQQEGVTPIDETQYPHHEKRGKGSTPARREPSDALGRAAFLLWQPDGEHFGDIGEGSGLACSKEETAGHHRRKIPSIPSEGGEGRPERHHPHEHFTRAKAVTQPAHGNFKQGVGETKRSEDGAHLLWR